MTITGSGNLLHCDVPECGTPPLVLPSALYGYRSEVKRQWAEARGWTRRMEWDCCPSHSVMVRPVEPELATVGGP